jgi:ABC-type iron transport system FetAB ATPase subunit
MIEITQGDKPIVRRSCVDLNGAAINLTSLSTAVLQISVDGSTALTRTMTVNSPPTAGIVQYQFVTADTPTPGVIRMAVILTFQDSTVITSTIENDVLIRAKIA